MDEKESSAESRNSPSQIAGESHAQYIKPPKKWARVMVALVRGERLHRFDAERLYHDHTLPSTISELQKKGVKIARREEAVPGYRGEPAYVARYWLDPDPENVARARALLAGERGVEV